jgi:hypothetical protein
MIKRLTFLSAFRAEAVGAREWVLLYPLRAEYELRSGATVTLEVPAGFTTDLASVPRVPGAYLLFGGHARRSAVLHDYLYSTDTDRQLADEVFLAAMRAEGEPWYVRGPMWLAVRLAGWAFRVRRGKPWTDS